MQAQNSQFRFVPEAGDAAALIGGATEVPNAGRRASVTTRLGESGLHDFLALASKMVPQNMGKSAGVASLQRVQDSFVLLNRKRPMLGRHRCDEARPSYARRYRFIKSGEYRVIGGANNALMDKSIATIIRQQIAGTIMLDHVGLQD